MILKQLYKQFLKSDCEPSSIDTKTSLLLKVCFFNKVHLPFLVSDGTHHVAAYFTKSSIVNFRKRYSPKTLFTDMYNRQIKITKWELEFTDVGDCISISKSETSPEKYTSYMNKEVSTF